MPPTHHSQKSSGRPRKHTTAAAKDEAKKESDQRRYQRVRQDQGLANFIAYQPFLSTDVPTETRAEIGLRTSANVPIPEDGGGQQQDSGSQQRARQDKGLAKIIVYQPLLSANVPTETRAEIGLQTSANLPIPQDGGSQQQVRQDKKPAKYIAYQPLLSANVPTKTRAEIGLQTSANIPSPQDGGSQPTNKPPNVLANYQRPTTTCLAGEEAEIAQQVKELRAREQEANAEQDEYNAAILERADELDARTAETLLLMRRGGEAEKMISTGDSPRLSSRAGVGRESCEESQHICSRLSASLGSPASAGQLVVEGNTSAGNSESSARSTGTKRSAGRRSLQTPSERSLLSLPQSSGSSRRTQSSRGSSRRTTVLPAQSNTLLSWLRPPLRGLPASSGSQQPVVQPSLATASPSSFRPPAPSRPLSLATASPSPFRPPAPSLDLNPRLDSASSASPALSHTTTTSRTPCSPPSRSPPRSPPPPPPPDPLEETAFKLSKQLRNFQGCTHEQHDEAETLHQEYHQRPNVHSACSSLRQITTILRGECDGGRPLPDVLSSPRLMKPVELRGVDCKSAFEGTSPAAFPKDVGTRNEGLPRNLCLSQHYSTSNKRRAAKVTYDIDSICSFPSSLAVARQGINWFPRTHPFLNITADIHFGLEVPAYNHRGDLTEKFMPLHTIPHYCFGSAIGMESLVIYIFFPALHLDSAHEHTTYLSHQDQELWYDAVLSPAVKKTIKWSNILQHYPASAHIANLDATALSAESLSRKDSSREQLLRYALQHQHLDPLWDCILESIAENPGVSRFAGATLFMHAKNTKLEHMDSSLPSSYGRWEACWSKVADPQFYNQNRTFVDLAKQVTSEDSALPYDRIPDDHEAEVLLWKSCCLKAYAQTREILNTDSSRAKGNARCTTYPWATMRDTMGQTLFAVPHGKESTNGLVYSQFYGLIKTPFDTAKTYVFQNESVENLALDPGYIQSLQQEGGGASFSKAVCKLSYLHSKKRAHANLIDNQWKSYGIREEHRISLAMMEAILEQWREWDLYDDSIDNADAPLPYYIVPTQELLSFLYAQINKHCFLFEHILAHTARTYSLPETIVMVVALRALRFCYGSSLIQKESLLYKNRWEHPRGQTMVVKEGLGMKETMERCGLGWFLPKFNWATWRLAPPHGDNILVGNLLMHKEYKRRWRAVKDLRDVHVRLHQTEGWYDQYQVYRSPRLRAKWLEYLHALNLAQFDADVWKTMLKANRGHPELNPEAIQCNGEVDYCHQGMVKMFLVDGAVSPPHFVTGNKMRFERAAELLNFLFLWDEEERPGWGNKPYRVILHKSFELIEQRLGQQTARHWLAEFLHLVRLTHWVLPYPSNTALISATKNSQRQGLKRRMMWFSAVYTNPEKLNLPPESMPSTAHLPLDSKPCTLYKILWNAKRQVQREGAIQPNGQERFLWGTSQLIAACQAQGVSVYGLEKGAEEYWVVGKKSAGLKGFTPVWERTWPPRLKMVEQIRGMSLDELDELMVEFTREYGGGDGAEGEGVGNELALIEDSSGEDSVRQHTPPRRIAREAAVIAREAAVRQVVANGDSVTASRSRTGTSIGSIFESFSSC